MTVFKFFDLDEEHQDEIVGHLDQKAAEKTLWEFIPKFSTATAFATANDVAIRINPNRVKSVVIGLEMGGKLRPILIDDLDEDGTWMEGIHRSVAAKQSGLKTVPVLFRIE